MQNEIEMLRSIRQSTEMGCSGIRAVLPEAQNPAMQSALRSQWKEYDSIYAEADRLLRQREEDARRAREFREQMERAKDNARSRGEAEAKRILRDVRTAADQVFQELSEMRKAQAKAERMPNENEARAALSRTRNEAE